MPPFTTQQIARIADEYRQVEERYLQLFMDYRVLPLKHETAAELMQHGFLRRLNTLKRCVHNVFGLIPPDLDRLPTEDELGDCAINLQAFYFNIFGCFDNLAGV